ncbi:hypothetical protein ACHWQZ_G015886 [Mnemiopsis leidyi]
MSCFFLLGLQKHLILGYSLAVGYVLTHRFSMTRKSPVHLTVEKDQPIHLHMSPGKSKVRTSSPKRGANKHSSSPAKEKPWIPAPCKTSKNKYTWAGSKAKLDITSPLNASSSSNIVIQVDSDANEEPTLLDKADNYRDRIADLSAEVDLLKTKSDLETLRGDLNTSLTETWKRDREIDIIQDDLYHTELENERLRNSLKHLADTDIVQRRSQSRLQEEREALLKRLVQAEADSMTAKRELSLLHSNIRQIRAEKDICQEDTDNLARQREDLLVKCAEAEDKNKQLRSELRENQLRLQDTGRLKEQHEKVLERLTQSDAANSDLRRSLLEMDKQISQLSRQVAAEKEEAEAYKHLQKTSEMSRSRTEEQLQASMGENTRLERKLTAVEGDIALEKKEHAHLKGLFAGYKEKAHLEKEALREKVRSYRDRALRSEEALESVSSQLETKKTKIKEMEGKEEALLKRIDDLSADQLEMSEAIDTLKRKLYLAEEKTAEFEDDLKTEKSKSKIKKEQADREVERLTAKCKQLKVSVDSLNNKIQEKEEELQVAATSNDAEAERLAKDAEFLRERLREAEELLSRYKTDNMMLHQRVEMAERDRGAMEHGNFLELEKVRVEYQDKLNELSQYPEKLSSAEARYQHAEAQTEALQMQLAQKNQTVEELQKKIDTFQSQIGKLKEKIHAVNEDNIELSNKAQSHERKVLEADLHSKNLMDLVSKKDEAVESHQLRIEELMRENAELSLQLETTLGDCRRQLEATKEKSLLKERSSNTRIEELEAQLGRASNTQTQLKRLKDEAEKRSQQRINEMRERLEQANNTTRSMQNYVNFLKQSYSSVFGDTTLDPASPYAGRLSPTFKRTSSPIKSPNFNLDY